MAADESCPICIETFNKSTRKQITCAYCVASMCRTCCQQWLLTDTAAEPNCASCHAVWNTDFLVANFPAAFRTGPFKRHREKVLFDREKVRLPEAQDEARRYKDAIEFMKPFDEERKQLDAKIEQLPEHATYLREKAYHTEVDDARVAYYRGKVTREEYEAMLSKSHYISAKYEFQKATLGYRQRIYDIQDLTRDARYIIEHFGVARDSAAPAAPVERKAFVRRCPAADCEGFLSTQWKCGLCDVKVCKECHECVENKDTHRCDPALVESIKAVESEAKPCPKCAAMISKIDGCDQMWCTQCQTAFSWKTGKIETSVVHNPHYFQWMREHGNTLPRQPGDVPGAGGACGDAAFDAFLYSRANRGKYTQLREAYRQVLDIQGGDETRRIRNEVTAYADEAWRRKYRVKRLAGEMDDKDWQIQLQREEKAFNKNRARLMLIDMFVGAAKDILRGIMVTPENETEILEQVAKLREFVEVENDKICEAYQCVPIHCLASKATRDKYIAKRTKVANKPVAAAGAGAADAGAAV